MPPPFGPGAFDGLADYLQGIDASLPARPKAILAVSGHWEADRPTVSTSPAPPMYFDYYGFPEHTYRLNYPAPGSPELAGRVRELLAGAGIASDEDPRRGFDHGVFVPFLKIYPDADIPVVALSLQHNLDPAQHIAIGRALQPLRDEGVLIVGSGMSYHNLRRFGDGDSRQAEAFDTWLAQAATHADPAMRDRELAQWTAAPCARDAHPREDHLLPLMVVAGAAGDDVGRHAFSEQIGGKAVSGFEFG
jgi:aromatic ring-opening dioxygenase catalytic subunit (LigB family)